MARILIRPEDLARLAQRFDAVADDLARSSRRLARARAEVRLNPADETFPAARVVERAARVEADLRRLAADFQVDAGLMARTVDDAEVDGDGRWALGLVSGPISGFATAPAVGSLDSVVTGLASLPGHTSRLTEGGNVGHRSMGAGGLFVRSPAAGAGHELLGRLTDRLSASSRSVDPTEFAGPSTHEVWTRIVGELFVVEEDS